MTDDADRVMRHALDGDLEAARRWVSALQRRSRDLSDEATRRLLEAALARPDAEGLAALAQALDALDVAAELLAEAWQGQREEDLEHGARALGFELDTDARRRLDALIEQTNVRCRVRKIERVHLLRALVHARLDAHGLGQSHAGETGMMGKTGIVLAVRLDGRMVVGATRGGGSSPSPGRGWSTLQPWRRDLLDNVGKAHAWAQQTASDRCEVARVELGAAARDVLERRARTASDPVMRLLSGGPSRGAFNKLVSLVNKTKDPGDAECLNDEIEAAIADWPVDVRSAGTMWLKSLAADHRRRHWRPGWRLIRQLELDAYAVPELDDYIQADDSGLRALLASPFVETLTTLRLVDSRPEVIALVFQADCWPALERLELSRANAAQLSALTMADAALLRRVGVLEVGVDPERARSMPAEMGAQREPGEVVLEIREPYWSVREKLLRLLATKLEGLRRVRLADEYWRELLVALRDGGALARCRQLTIETDRFTRGGMTTLLDSLRVASKLEALSLSGHGPRNPQAMAAVAAIEALAGVTRLELRGEGPQTMVAVLGDSPLGRDLGVLLVGSSVTRV